jgi:LPXTG-motif cell wall-anchored protein
LPEEPIYFRLSNDAVVFYDGEGVVITPDSSSALYVPADSAVNMTVINRSGIILPMTGGIGTQFYTLCGLLLITAAVCRYMLRRRSERRDNR